MNNRVRLLDCTLRDGGYINEWNFGREAIRRILFGLSKSNLDIIECGFLMNRPYNPDFSLFHGVEDVYTVLPEKPKGQMVVAMIAIGEKEIDPALLSDADKGPVDGIRLTFHQHEIEKALQYGKVIMEKGYKLFMQPVGMTGYSDGDMIDLIGKINELNPYAFYIVDTLGVMYKKDLIRRVFLVDNNLKKGICMGFHSHNNLQMSFANSQALIDMDMDRDIIIDCSANGMGRGAGNLCSELLMDYINKNMEKRYDVLPVLEIIDEYLMAIYMSVPWGYSAAYFLAAINDCHPNYASFLLARQSINMRTISSILEQIPKGKRREFDKGLMEQLYQSYQVNAVDDIQVIGKLRRAVDGKKVLVVAPGRTVVDKKAAIQAYLKKNQPVVISINFVPKDIPVDYVFVGNSKRFQMLKNRLEPEKMILTSNIQDAPEGALVVNYSDLTNPSADAADSSGMMLLKLLIKISVKGADLAGFDGFRPNQVNNYVSESMVGISDPLALEEKNLAMNQQLNAYAEDISLRFVTPTKYKLKKAHTR